MPAMPDRPRTAGSMALLPAYAPACAGFMVGFVWSTLGAGRARLPGVSQWDP